MKLKIKDFDEVKGLPKKIQPQIRMDYMGESKYYWSDFIKGMGKAQGSFGELCNYFRMNVNRVLARIDNADLFVRKIAPEYLTTMSKKLAPEVFCYYDGDKYKTITLNKLLTSAGLLKHVRRYDALTFDPRDKCTDSNKFNTWSGFKAKLLDPKDVDPKKIKPILDLLKDIWAAGDEKVYNYFLNWFRHAFRTPYIKTKVGIILYSEKQQIGKGVFINNFLVPLVYGKQFAASVPGLDPVIDKFNTIMMNKLFINCDGLYSLAHGGAGSFHKVFNRFKKLITDNTITIKPKGLNKIANYPDYCNYILTTNNTYCFKIEEYDAQHLMMVECSGVRVRDFDYFSDLCDNEFTQENADQFFSYCYYLEKFGVKQVNILDIPETNLKRKVKVHSYSSAQRFLYYVAKEREEPREYLEEESKKQHIDWRFTVKNKDKISPAEFYKTYKEYCTENGEKALSAHNFSRDAGKMMEKKREGGTGRILYLLGTIKCAGSDD